MLPSSPPETSVNQNASARSVQQIRQKIVIFRRGSFDIMSNPKLAEVARSRARAQRFRQLAISLTAERDSAAVLREAHMSEVEADRLEAEIIAKVAVHQSI